MASRIGQKGILWCLFVPKRSKMAQEMAELGPFSLLRGWVIPLTSTSLLMHHCIIVSGKWLGDSRTAKFLSGSHKKVNWSPQEEKEQEELQWSVANWLFLGKPVKMVLKKIGSRNILSILTNTIKGKTFTFEPTNHSTKPKNCVKNTKCITS